MADRTAASSWEASRLSAGTLPLNRTPQGWIAFDTQACGWEHPVSKAQAFAISNLPRHPLSALCTGWPARGRHNLSQSAWHVLSVRLMIAELSGPDFLHPSACSAYRPALVSSADRRPCKSRSFLPGSAQPVPSPSMWSPPWFVLFAASDFALPWCSDPLLARMTLCQAQGCIIWGPCLLSTPQPCLSLPEQLFQHSATLRLQACQAMRIDFSQYCLGSVAMGWDARQGRWRYKPGQKERRAARAERERRAEEDEAWAVVQQLASDDQDPSAVASGSSPHTAPPLTLYSAKRPCRARTPGVNRTGATRGRASSHTGPDGARALTASTSRTPARSRPRSRSPYLHPKPKKMPRLPPKPKRRPQPRSTPAETEAAEATMTAKQPQTPPATMEPEDDMVTVVVEDEPSLGMWTAAPIPDACPTPASTTSPLPEDTARVAELQPVRRRRPRTSWLARPSGDRLKFGRRLPIPMGKRSPFRGWFYRRIATQRNVETDQKAGIRNWRAGRYSWGLHRPWSHSWRLLYQDINRILLYALEGTAQPLARLERLFMAYRLVLPKERWPDVLTVCDMVSRQIHRAPIMAGQNASCEIQQTNWRQGVSILPAFAHLPLRQVCLRHWQEATGSAPLVSRDMLAHLTRFMTCRAGHTYSFNSKRTRAASSVDESQAVSPHGDLSARRTTANLCPLPDTKHLAVSALDNASVPSTLQVCLKHQDVSTFRQHRLSSPAATARRTVDHLETPCLDLTAASVSSRAPVTFYAGPTCVNFVRSHRQVLCGPCYSVAEHNRNAPTNEPSVEQRPPVLEAPATVVYQELLLSLAALAPDRPVESPQLASQRLQSRLLHVRLTHMAWALDILAPVSQSSPPQTAAQEISTRHLLPIRVQAHPLARQTGRDPMTIAAPPVRPRSWSKEDLMQLLSEPQCPQAIQLRRSVHHDIQHCRSVQEINDCLTSALQLHLPPRAGSTRLAPWQSPAMQGGIRAMWTHYRQWRQAANRQTSTIWRAWFHYAKFQKAHRDFRRAGRLAKHAWYSDRLHELGMHARRHNIRALYQGIRQLAPKKRYTQVQLRAPDGGLISPEKQAQLLSAHLRSSYTGQFCQPERAETMPSLHMDPTALSSALAGLSVHKAVPEHLAPIAAWRLCSEEVMPKLSELVNDLTTIDELWHAAWLALIPKVTRPTLPKHLRPIGVTEVSGRIVSKILQNRLRPFVLEYLKDLPQFAYVPGRGTLDSVLRVQAHCQAVIDSCMSADWTTREARAGIPKPQATAGGLQLSLDLSSAFDHMEWIHIATALDDASVPLELQAHVLEWYRDIKYVLTVQGQTVDISASRGLKQGCLIAPLIWSLVTGRFLYELALCADPLWVTTDVTTYADDFHAGSQVSSYAELCRLEVRLGQLLDILCVAGLTVNAQKSAVLFLFRGTFASKWLKQHLRTTPDGQVMRLRTPTGRLFEFPVVEVHTYLGVRISYKNPRLATLQHRVQLVQAEWSRLRKVVCSKRGLFLKDRINVWRASIPPMLTYGLAATGLPAGGLSQLRTLYLRQLRAILRSPAHLHRVSNEAILRKAGVPDVAEIVERDLARLQANLQQLQVEDSSLLVRESVNQRPFWNAATVERPSQLTTFGEPMRKWSNLRNHIAKGQCPFLCSHQIGTDATGPQLESATLSGTDLGSEPEALEMTAQERLFFGGVCPSLQSKREREEGPSEKRPRTADALASFQSSAAAQMPQAPKGKGKGKNKGKATAKGQWGGWNRQSTTWGQDNWPAGQGAWSTPWTSEYGLPDMVQKLTSLAIKHEYAINSMMQDHTLYLFVKPGDEGLLPILFATSEKWNATQQTDPSQITEPLRLVMMKAFLIELGQRLKATKDQPESMQKAKELGWLTEQGQWKTLVWDPTAQDLREKQGGKLHVTDDLIGQSVELRKLITDETLFRFQSLRGLSRAPQTAWVQLAIEVSVRDMGNRVWEILHSWIGCAALHTMGCRLRRERGGLSQQARTLRGW
ncbi:pol [Symbiodinium sp. CCMP2592]|nr:pol [Symbiodinium sp. CCMP2592]